MDWNRLLKTVFPLICWMRPSDSFLKEFIFNCPLINLFYCVKSVFIRSFSGPSIRIRENRNHYLFYIGGALKRLGVVLLQCYNVLRTVIFFRETSDLHLLLSSGIDHFLLWCLILRHHSSFWVWWLNQQMFPAVWSGSFWWVRQLLVWELSGCEFS